MTTHLEWSIGDVKVTRVEERVIPIPWAALVPGGEQHIDACRPWMEPFITETGSHFLLSVHSFVVQTPENLIVVDTCVGDTDEFQLPGDPGFGERLASALSGGLDGVDVVVCTHLHFDHVGWNTVEVEGQRRPRFANARYLVSADEMRADRDEEDTASYMRSVEPLRVAGVLDEVALGHRIDEWVALEPSVGHTPGHVSVRITSDEQVAVITGDFIHTPLQFAHPEASSNPDHDKAQATATRERYVTELANTETLVLGSHFAPPTSGKIKQNQGKTTFQS